MSEKIDNTPKNAFEAAIDRATGYKPGDESSGMDAVAQDGQQADDSKVGGDNGDAGAGQVGQQADDSKKNRDWVKEAYECFIKNAVDLEPTNPAGAVWEYFKKNATDELKAKVETDGKTGSSCWKFIEAVARKALGNKSGHIDSVAIYAIAMHYFQDVPKDWNDKKLDPKAEVKSKELDAKAAIRARKIAHNNRVKLAKELRDKEFAEKVAAEGKELAKAEVGQQADNSKFDSRKKAKARKGGKDQGFFFDLLETETVGPADGQQAYDSKIEKEAGDAE